MEDALYNKTGIDKNKFNQVKTFFKPFVSIKPPEKYSGKLNIMILLKQKPATPILIIATFTFDEFLFSMVSCMLILGSYPTKASVSTTLRNDTSLGLNETKISFF